MSKSIGRSQKRLVAAGLLAGALHLGGCALQRPPGPEDPMADTAQAHSLGIEVIGVRRSAAGYMLDLRYRVVNAQKAATLLNRQVQPYLVDEASGAKLFVPSSAKVGPLRQTSSRAVEGRIYFALFANPGRYVASGRKVTLVLGDQRLSGLTVE